MNCYYCEDKGSYDEFSKIVPCAYCDKGKYIRNLVAYKEDAKDTIKALKDMIKVIDKELKIFECK